MDPLEIPRRVTGLVILVGSTLAMAFWKRSHRIAPWTWAMGFALTLL
jgi:hypothetical protein